ncbi:lysosome-associated membrane glycoprotein 1-like [Branchiostoma floridae]|uniref:Lysosome-associated membrane glycoprotein 1-like n=1 Tax=Branchiostoma floridae TaxID=7739 RepID=A0A9J7MJG3_BRAFL|nr:lysosome-associated membrane glycoprotein 1-like [Branchiostoma floridae]
MRNLTICPVLLLLCLAGAIAQVEIPTFLPTSDTTARPTTRESPLLNANDDPTVLQGSLKYPNGTACLLYKMGLAVQILYGTTDSRIGVARFALPTDTTVGGFCGVTAAMLQFAFNNGTYNVSLEFTNDGKQFEVSAASVGWVFDSTNFPNASLQGKSAAQNNTQGDLGLFYAPLGQSYLCRSEDSKEISVDVTLFFIEVQVQPFDVTAGKFGQPLECKKDMPTTPAPTTKVPTTPAMNTTTAPNTTLAPTTTASPIMNTTTVPGTTASPPTHRGKWHVRSENDTCLLAYMAVRFEAHYLTNDGSNGTAAVWLPTDATADGSCSEHNSVIELRSDVSNLTINFLKAAGSTSWSASSIFFSYRELPAFFIDTANPGQQHIVRVDHINMFMTGTGQSYKCDTEISVPLKDGVTLKLSQLQVQAFDVQHGDFGTPKRCPADLPPTPAPTMTPLCPHLPPPGKWVVKDAKGNPCLLADMALQLRSRYITADNATTVGCIGIPTNADVTGVCGQNTSQLSLSFHAGEFNITFTFSESPQNSSNPGSGDKFGVSQVSVEYFINDIWFPSAQQQGQRVKITTPNMEIFEARVGQSYQCMRQTNVTLNKDVTLFTQDLHLQPFSVSGYGFAKSYVCPEDPTPEPSWKANIVPMAVGCALGAFVIVVTLGTYIVYRRRQKRMAGYSLLSTT